MLHTHKIVTDKPAAYGSPKAKLTRMVSLGEMIRQCHAWPSHPSSTVTHIYHFIPERIEVVDSTGWGFALKVEEKEKTAAGPIKSAFSKGGTLGRYAIAGSELPEHVWQTLFRDIRFPKSTKTRYSLSLPATGE